MTHINCGGKIEIHPTRTMTVPYGGGMTGPEGTESYPVQYCVKCNRTIIGDSEICYADAD